MNIAFTFNVKHNTNYSTDANQDDIEFDSIDVIEAIENTIKSLGHTVIKIEADNEAYIKLKSKKNEIDLVFNIAEGLKGDARESQIPIFCEMLGIPFTHSSPTTHAIKLKKLMCNKYLKSFGVNVPNGVIINKTTLETISRKEFLEINNLNFPLFVKPNQQGSSKGVFNDSVVNDKDSLVKMVLKILNEYDSEAIIEEYIDGREFTVPMLGNPPRILPIIEQRFDFLPKGFNKVAGYELKWLYEDKLPNPFDSVYCPAPLDVKLEVEIHKICKIIWNALEVKDIARLDFRYKDTKSQSNLPINKRLYFLEINTLPGINPDEKMVSYLPYSAKIAGLSYKDLIKQIIDSAKARYNL